MSPSVPTSNEHEVLITVPLILLLPPAKRMVLLLVVPVSLCVRVCESVSVCEPRGKVNDAVKIAYEHVIQFTPQH